MLTKQIIRENYDDLFSIVIDPRRRKMESTGGSTGTPLKFCIDAAEWSAWKASTLRAWEWYGLHLGDKIFSLGGNSIVKGIEGNREIATWNISGFFSIFDYCENME